MVAQIQNGQNDGAKLDRDSSRASAVATAPKKRTTGARRQARAAAVATTVTAVVEPQAAQSISRERKGSALPEPAEPPPASLYARHALALKEAVTFVHGHWQSFADLIPERFLDGVEEGEIYNNFRTLTESLLQYAGRVAIWHELTDDLYGREYREHSGFQEHEDIAGLNAIVRLHRQSEQRKDALDAEITHDSKTAPARPRENEPADTRVANNVMWQCFDWWGVDPIGWLITGSDDINDLIAFVHDDGYDEDVTARHLDQARSILANRDMVDRCDGAVDLRECGESFHGPAIPPFIFSLACKPCDSDGRASTGARYLSPTPKCMRADYETLQRLFSERFSTKELSQHYQRGLNLTDVSGGGTTSPLWIEMNDDRL